MPLCLSHPIALAALAIFAIGFISYNIITNKKKKIPVRERRIEYVEDFKPILKSHEDSGVRKRRNANTEIKKPSNEKTESEKLDNVSAESNNRSSSYCNQTHPDISPGSSVEKEGFFFFNNLDSLTPNIDDSKILNSIHNINQEDGEKLNITKTVVDEDAQSSASNVSLTDAKDLAGETTSNSEHQKSIDDSEANISEKLYKREVCDCLRNEIETMTISSHADSHLSENDDDDMCNLRDLDGNTQKPVICRGCEESYANAVAHPCGHRYLCLDCAIKVHRIHKKCSVCNFHIETYDIYNTRQA